jgi:hypothetical protein
MKNLIAVFALALSLIGCASVNMGDAKQDEALKTFTIEKDKAGVYIYRNESMGAAIKMNVELDGSQLARRQPIRIYTRKSPRESTHLHPRLRTTVPLK